jgi:hypothetical protein
VLLAQDGLPVEELGSNNGVSELFEKLGIVGAFDG